MWARVANQTGSHDLDPKSGSRPTRILMFFVLNPLYVDGEFPAYVDHREKYLQLRLRYQQTLSHPHLFFWIGLGNSNRGANTRTKTAWPLYMACKNRHITK